MDDRTTMRIDRYLWWARIAKSRSAAQAMAHSGLVRLDGRRIERSHTPVRTGSILAFAWQGQVRVIRILALPQRRGPPAEAMRLYEELHTKSPNPVDVSGAAA